MIKNNVTQNKELSLEQLKILLTKAEKKVLDANSRSKNWKLIQKHLKNFVQKMKLQFRLRLSEI